MVRLKEYLQLNDKGLEAISIPYGSIKSVPTISDSCINQIFQFLMVRLKADTPQAIINQFVEFQFLMVRLKVKVVPYRRIV